MTQNWNRQYDVSNVSNSPHPSKRCPLPLIFSPSSHQCSIPQVSKTPSIRSPADHFLMLCASEFTVPVRDVFDASGRLTVADAQLHSSSLLSISNDPRLTRHSCYPVCAVCALTKTLAIRDCSVNPPATPVFQLTDGSPVTSTGLVTFVLHLLRFIGIDPPQNSGHSFLICCAISALSDYGIKLIGRSNSDCYRTYIRHERFRWAT